MAAEKEDAKATESSKIDISEEDARKESSKVAKQATEAQKKATELMKAAATAGDPEERQKLMEQALEQQIQSKSLGKTAKYLRSGTFQGMAVGAGLGIAPGASLGAITGTLVGGVSSTALGGVGAGLGAVTGWIHGPFWDIGKGAGKGIQKITGNLPGWKATESQKKQLEKMVGQINEQDAPGEDELEEWKNESSSDEQGEAIQSAKSTMPSVHSTEAGDQPKKQGAPTKKKEQASGNKERPSGQGRRQSPEPQEELPKSGDSTQGRSNTNGAQQACKKRGGKETAYGTQEITQETRPTYKNAAVQTEEEGRKKPCKLQTKPDNGNSSPNKPNATRKQPRKLEKRST
jgi:hypothetical protein